METPEQLSAATEARLDRLERKVSKIESRIQIAIGVLAVFGLAGGVGGLVISEASRTVSDLRRNVTELQRQEADAEGKIRTLEGDVVTLTDRVRNEVKLILDTENNALLNIKTAATGAIDDIRSSRDEAVSAVNDRSASEQASIADLANEERKKISGFAEQEVHRLLTAEWDKLANSMDIRIRDNTRIVFRRRSEYCPQDDRLWSQANAYVIMPNDSATKLPPSLQNGYDSHPGFLSPVGSPSSFGVLPVNICFRE